ncbi:MAG: hypothetical protein COY58_03445 [Gammaproteobacteria bacterium CG_4_10_14_0_8_um_filter_38_16]|nr:MAG: hypothetical protein COY58_03445 [Gammaproteobacteria bacterium CG_4_10_14_0_8_um_filter_38_16]PJA03637.1 MAG: hypothetical protein COX72_03830 [Gammaproteobacteria bacterium CG_4_10_14_0_2_um_filter_38_22]
MKWIRSSLILLFSLVSLMLVSCHNNQSQNAQKNAQRFVKQLEAASEIKDENKKEEVEVKPVVYEGVGLRNPFEVPALVKNTKLYPNAILTNMALDNLKLTGIILHDNRRWAVLRANDGKLYRIDEGMRVGLQQALVVHVDQNQVVFRIELEADATNKELMESHEIVMTLQEPGQ